MLVLSRQKNEQIVIGDAVSITVVEIRGDKVRLGIAAPPEVPVHRKEVAQRIRESGEISPAEERAKRLNGQVVEWCMAVLCPGSLPEAPAPEASLAAMLEAARVVKELGPIRKEDGSMVFEVTCDDRVIALRYALDQYGGVMELLKAMGVEVRVAAMEEE